MPTDVPVRCRCGTVRGVARAVSGNAGNRVLCYCDDCQSFAHFLGSPNEILDAHGGTDVFQMSPAHLELVEGLDAVACVSLRPGGLLRWYATCCRTPIANTLPSRQFPFVGLIHRCCDHGAAATSRDGALGPVRGRIQGRYAKGDRAALGAHDRAPAGMYLRMLPKALMWRLRGDHARSPFFDPASAEPIVEPRVLTPAELADIEAARDAWAGGGD